MATNQEQGIPCLKKTGRHLLALHCTSAESKFSGSVSQAGELAKPLRKWTAYSNNSQQRQLLFKGPPPSLWPESVETE